MAGLSCKFKEEGREDDLNMLYEAGLLEGNEDSNSQEHNEVLNNDCKEHHGDSELLGENNDSETKIAGNDEADIGVESRTSGESKVEGDNDEFNKDSIPTEDSTDRNDGRNGKQESENADSCNEREHVSENNSEQSECDEYSSQDEDAQVSYGNEEGLIVQVREQWDYFDGTGICQI